MSATLKSPDVTTIPTDESSSFAPFGPELVLFSGWIDPATGLPYILPTTGLVELIPMGIFPMLDTKVLHNGPDITMAVIGADRSWPVSQFSFKTIWPVTAGTSPEAAIQAILSDRAPWLPLLNMAPTGFSLPLMNFNNGSDPWAACLTIAGMAGCQLYPDANGVPTAKPTPDPTQQKAVWSYRVDGAGNALPSSVARNMTRRGVSNDFTYSGTGSQNTPLGSGAAAPISANSSDTNPQSPTWIGGPFGDVPTFATSSLISATPQAQAAADNAKAISLGSADIIIVTASPAPMFSVDDVLELEDTQINVDFNIVLDAISYSSQHGTKTTLTARRVY